MSSSVVETFRGIAVEDFMTATSFAQTTGTVLGVGTGVVLTPFVVAASDAAAAAASVPLGAVYINNGGAFAYLKARLT